MVHVFIYMDHNFLWSIRLDRLITFYRFVIIVLEEGERTVTSRNYQVDFSNVCVV
jgi:hypothetical protein